MKSFRFALLLLVQLSPILVHGNGEAVPEYMCESKKTSVIEPVKSASAQLTKACVVDGTNKEGIGITFDLKAMYKAAALKAPKAPVMISITGATFINSYIKLINADKIPDIDNQVPLQFTMTNGKMSGSSKLEFGSAGKIFKLPPKSTLSIVESHLTISSTVTNAYTDVITFHSLQLVTESSIEITNNVITMECEGCREMAVFFIPRNSKMKISDKSKFTVKDNTITMNGDFKQNKNDIYQCVLYGSVGAFTISENSEFTWAVNNIKMIGHSVAKDMYQSVWFEKFPLTISKTSTYIWERNKISMVGHDVTGKLHQYVWNNGNIAGDKALLTISASVFKWILNEISMTGYNNNRRAKGSLFQTVWNFYRKADITISAKSTYTWESNTINILGHHVTDIDQYVSRLISPLTISDSSNYKWVTNKISMTMHDITKDIYQIVWMTHDLITITSSEFLFETNKILMTAKDYVSIEAYVMWLKGTGSSGTISGGSSSMVWRNNCVAMGHTKSGMSRQDLMDHRIIIGTGRPLTDKRHMFAGEWSITGEGSELLLDGNYITTTEKYGPSNDKLTALVWDPTKDTAFTIGSGGKLTIGETQVYSNSATTDKTATMMWESSSFTPYTNVKQPAMEWSSCTAKDTSGFPIPIPTQDISKYVCVAIPITPPTSITNPTKDEAAHKTPDSSAEEQPEEPLNDNANKNPPAEDEVQKEGDGLTKRKRS